jgi:hypothetical protein
MVKFELMRSKFIIFFTLLIITFSSCFLRYTSYKKFTLKKSNLNSSTFKTNGFYFMTNGKIVQGYNSKGIQFHIYYFYSDGTFGISGYFGNTLKGYVQKYQTDLSFSQDIKQSMNRTKAWGRYQVNNDSLLIQYFGLINEIKYEIYEEKGIITSDNSFMIKEKTYYETIGDTTNNTFHLPFIFYFYPCDNCKPDSINWLMRRKP